MTPQQHLDHAERLLNTAAATLGGHGGDFITSDLLMALCHAMIATAAEQGVPHSYQPAGGGEPSAPPGTA